MLVAGNLAHRFAIHHGARARHEPNHNDQNRRLEPPRLGEHVRELRHAGPGDVVVQRGTNHAWANRGTEPCTIMFVLIDGVTSSGEGKGIPLRNGN